MRRCGTTATTHGRPAPAPRLDEWRVSSRRNVAARYLPGPPRESAHSKHPVPTRRPNLKNTLALSLPLSLGALAALSTLAPGTARAEGKMTAGESTPAGKNMLWNGAFDAEHLRPWSVMFDSPRFGSAAVKGGELCFNLAEPSAHLVDVVLRQRPIAVAKGHHYQLRLKVHATAPTKLRPRFSKISAPYTEVWAATVDADATAKTWAGTFD